MLTAKSSCCSILTWRRRLQWPNLWCTRLLLLEARPSAKHRLLLMVRMMLRRMLHVRQAELLHWQQPCLPGVMVVHLRCSAAGSAASCFPLQRRHREVPPKVHRPWLLCPSGQLAAGPTTL